MVKIRRGSVCDAEGIAKVIASVIAEEDLTSLEKQFTVQEEENFIASMSDREAIFVAEADGKIVGAQSICLYSSMRAMRRVATIGTWVHKDCRGKGIGKSLTQKSSGFAEKKGFEKIFTYLMATIRRALAFYRRLGFGKVGVAEKQTKLGTKYYYEVYVEKLLK